MGYFCELESGGDGSFNAKRISTARKNHQCCECGHTIVPGEEYETVAGKWDGEFYTVKTCIPCTDLRDALSDISNGCVVYGALGEAYAEHLENEIWDPERAREQYNKVMRSHRDGKAL